MCDNFVFFSDAFLRKWRSFRSTHFLQQEVPVSRSIAAEVRPLFEGSFIGQTYYPPFHCRFVEVCRFAAIFKVPVTRKHTFSPTKTSFESPGPCDDFSFPRPASLVTSHAPFPQPSKSSNALFPRLSPSFPTRLQSFPSSPPDRTSFLPRCNAFFFLRNRCALFPSVLRRPAPCAAGC